MEAEAKPVAVGPEQLLFPPPSFSLLRLRRPILRSIAQVQARFEEVEKGTKSWLAAQPFSVETAVCAAGASFQSAFVALSMSYLAGDYLRLPDLSTVPALKPLNLQPQGPSNPLVEARNFAVMEGVNAVLACSMRRIKGKEDLQGRMVAGFGSGAVFSIVSGMGAGTLSRQAAFAVSSGIFFAALQGGVFQAGQAISAWSANNRSRSKAKVVIGNLPSHRPQAVVDTVPCCQSKSALDNFTTFQRDLLTNGTLALENTLRPFREAPLQIALCLPLLTDTNSELKKLP